MSFLKAKKQFCSRMGAVFAVVALGLAAGAPQAFAACSKIDTVKVQEYPGLIQNLVPWVAIQEGFFKKNCLKPEMLAFPSGPAALAASLQGGLNFISLAPDTVYVPVSKGFDLKIVAFMNDTVHYALVTGKDTKLPPASAGYEAIMKALIGKRIGVNALGSTTDTLAKSAFTAAGLDYTKVAWTAYGPLAAGVAGLENGSLAAAMFFADGMDIAKAATGGRILVDFRYPDAKRIPLISQMKGASLLWAVQSEYIKQHPDVIRRFAKANNEAIAWIKDPKNYDAIVELVREKAPTPKGLKNREEILQLRVKNYLPQESAHASMSALEAWNKWDVKMKRISKPANVEGLLYKTAKEMMTP